MEQPRESKKRLADNPQNISFRASEMQLDSTELDGNYWSVSSSSRIKKPTPSREILNSVDTKKPAPKPKPTPSVQNLTPSTSTSTSTNSNSNVTTRLPAQNILPTNTPSPNLPFHIASASTYGNISTSHSYDIPFQLPYVPSHTTLVTPPPPPLPMPIFANPIPSSPDLFVPYSPSITPASFSLSGSSHLPQQPLPQQPLLQQPLFNIPPPPPLPQSRSSTTIKTEEPAKLDKKKSEVELDGTYWASFDAGAKRKKERALSDLTAVDSDYWNKRNARVQSRKRIAPEPISEEQAAKRAEKLARAREEQRMREDAEHERLTRKLEQSRVGKEVYAGIFLGSKHAAQNWEFFEQNQIRAVVNVTTEVQNYHERTGVTYMRIPVSDLPSVELLDTFEKSAAAISELTKKGNVLIHCKEGKSRSPSICMAYAMKYLNMKLADAHESIVQKSEIRVNLGFQQQLMSYERQVFNLEYNSFNFLQKRNA